MRLESFMKTCKNPKKRKKGQKKHKVRSRQSSPVTLKGREDTLELEISYEGVIFLVPPRWVLPEHPTCSSRDIANGLMDIKNVLQCV